MATCSAMMETTEASRTPFLPELENLGPAPVPHDRPALSRLQSFYERAKDTTKLYLAFEPYEVRVLQSQGPRCGSARQVDPVPKLPEHRRTLLRSQAVSTVTSRRHGCLVPPGALQRRRAASQALTGCEACCCLPRAHQRVPAFLLLECAGCQLPAGAQGPVRAGQGQPSAEALRAGGHLATIRPFHACSHRGQLHCK